MSCLLQTLIAVLLLLWYIVSMGVAHITADYV